MASIDPDYLQNELYNLGLDIRDYIKRSRFDDLSEFQFGIVLKQKIKEVSDKNRQLIMSQEINLEQKIASVVKLSPVISEALNLFPKKFRGTDQFLDLTIVHNFLILNIAGMGRLQDIWRLQASANILTKLLVGVPRLEGLPDLDTIKVDDNNKQEIIRIRNALSLTAGLFLEAVIGIYNYGRDNLIQWSSEAFYNFSLYKKLLMNVNLVKLATGNNVTGEQVFVTFRTFLMPIWNGLVLLLNMSRIHGENWPEGIDFHGLISQGGTTGVIEYIQFVRETFDHELKKVYQAYTDGLFSKNDNPAESSHIKRMEVIAKFAKLYQTHLTVTKNLIGFEVPAGSFELDNLIIESYQLKDRIDILNPNAEDPFNSEMLPFYHDLFELIIPQLALQSFLSQDTEPYALIREYYHRIKNAGAKTIILHYLALKGEISFYLRGLDTDDVNYLLKEIEDLKPFFELKHREFIDLHILEILMLLKADRITLMTDKIEQLHEIIVELDLSGEEDVLLKKYLRHFETGEVVEFNKHRSVYDYHTWLIPDTIIGTSKSFQYIPIPAAINKIVD